MTGNCTTRTRTELKRYLKEDLNAHGLEKWSPYIGLKRPEVAFQRTLRYAEFWSPRSGLLAAFPRTYWRIRLQRKSIQTGLSVPIGVAGPGLAIAHYGSVVINSDVRIGRNFRIHSSTNIGSNKQGVPTIGDDVYVGPGAVIYGPISVGSGSVIGANSVVNSNVPPNVTVAGSPARIISEKGSSSIHPNVK